LIRCPKRPDEAVQAEAAAALEGLDPPPAWPLGEVRGVLTRPLERESSRSGDAGPEMTGADSTSPRQTLRRSDPAEARNAEVKVIVEFWSSVSQQ
jgi:hypothetical protein